ncbi:MAG: hypothetical protein FJ216_04560 [Ignavibacteria bacterium]|nr:hypothetical protein [Ignavibacteria bacterium]
MNKYKPLLKFLLILSILSFPLLGSQCQKALDDIFGSGDVVGSWKLVRMEGNLQDVCLGEIAEFRQDNTATLTCPGKTPVNRTYTYTNNILTYSETGISYSVYFEAASYMILTGQNVNRTLYYEKIYKK